MARAPLHKILLSVSLLAALAALPVLAGGLDEDIALESRIFDEEGRPIEGMRTLLLTYFAGDGEAVFAETLDEVHFVDGRFRLVLGTGTADPSVPQSDLLATLAGHPELDIEVSVEGAAYEPRIGVLPAGHSLKSRLVAAGIRSADDGEPHWKGYEAKNGRTAVQSRVLRPAGTKPTAVSDDTVRRNPYTLPIIGPKLSASVRDLPLAERRPMQDAASEINPPRHEALFDADGNRFGTATEKVQDYLADSAPVGFTPSLSLSFEGIDNVNGVLPPDTEGTVGPNHYIQVVNLSFAIYDKSGTLLTGPSNTNTLWAGFGGPCQTDNSGDAIFMYDQQADRFVLSQFAVAGSHQSVCFAISQTGDPTGSYYLYEVVTPRFPDYYKAGVWPDSSSNAYFFGTNSGFQGQYDVFAIDRANMLAGAAARPMQFFQNFVNLMMPADVDGGTGPPSGSPGIFYTFRDGGESYFSSPPSDSIDVWEFDVDWSTPANSTFTLVESITPAEGLANFNWTVCGFFVSNCIPQPGTSQGIDSASWWPMQRLVYRNFGSHEALVGAWTVDVNSSGNRAAPRWFELRDFGSGWSLYQQGTHSPDSIHRWMPSIAMDGSGNIAIGYSRGNASNFASVYYATREAGDPLGTLQAEALLHAAGGSQTHSAARWGDYASMELDPADDCTFWFTTEYLASTGSAPWRTRVGTFVVPGCGGPPVPDFTLSCSPSDFSISQGASDASTCTVTAVNGYTQSVGLSCAGAPAGVTCGFAPTSGTPTYNSTLTIGVGASTAEGSHNFDVVADDGTSSKTFGLTLEVTPEGSNGPQDAVFNGTYQAPACLTAGSECDSVDLLDGRNNLGPESNQPNTILGSCSDGGSGSYHSDESNDRIVVKTLDSGNFTEGDTVDIEATVWAWSNGSADTLDLYYAADATSPVWTYISSIVPPAGGAQTLTAQYTLPTGDLQAVRARFRYQGSAAACTTGNYDDHDDLVFAVEAPGGNATPVVTITAPANGSTFTQGASVGFAGTADDEEDGDISGSLAWSSNLDGAIGSGASFSTSSLSLGTHTITASVTDSGGLEGSNAISVTIEGPNQPPVVTITAPANGSSFTLGASVAFAGTASDPEDGNISGALAWTSSLNGSIGSGASFATSSLSVGTHLITASVVDSGGLPGSAAINVTIVVVTNQPPVVSITAPANGSTFTEGTSVGFAGTANDPEDGDISGALAWSSDLDGSIGAGASFSTSSLSVGMHTITAAVNDSGGLPGSDAITVTIDPSGVGGPHVWMSFTTNTAVPGVGTVRDEDIVSYDETTGQWALEFDGSDVGLGSLEISGMAVLPSGDLLLSLNVAGTVGGVSFDDSDILQFTPTSMGASTAGTFSMYFDGSDVGLTTNGEDIDAIALASDGRIIVSTRGGVNANGASGADEDLWTFTGTLGSNTSGSFTRHFDGSDVGLSSSGSEDVNAATMTAGGNLLFSTVGSFSVSGVSGADEDVTEFAGTFGNATSGTFSVRLDLSALGISTTEDVGSLFVIE